MTTEMFIHYVVCQRCKKQLRVVSPNFGVRCCTFLWFNDGPMVVRYLITGGGSK